MQDGFAFADLQKIWISQANLTFMGLILMEKVEIKNFGYVPESELNEFYQYINSIIQDFKKDLKHDIDPILTIEDVNITDNPWFRIIAEDKITNETITYIINHV
jgi:hypothetical protein